MGEIPEWLRPYCRQDAYNPTKEDIEKLEPQSRDEMLLKSLINSMSVDLSNYYNKQEVDSLVDTIPKFDIKVVQTLPSSNISPTTIYLVPSQSESSDVYKEYIYVNNNWELLGIQKVDLSNYYNKTEINNLLNTKVDKVTGKGLSTEDYTTAEKTKLSGIESEANKTIVVQTTGASTTDVMSQNAVSTALNNYYNKTETDNLLNSKVNSSDLSTVATSGSYNDLSNKPTIPTKTSDLTNDSNFVSRSDLSNSYYSKTQTDNLLDTKVNKVTGKGLSTNDYTTAEKTKLSNIEAEANKTVIVQATGSSTTSVMSQNALTSALGDKVDKVSGKSLSTNDYTTAEKTKLSNIEAEANKTVIVQSTGSSTTSVMSQNAVTTQLNNKATTTLYTATLSSSSWSSSAPYTQTVSISGILSTDTPIVDVVLRSTTSTAISQIEAWMSVSKIETANGSITATCFEEKPTINIPIQLKVVR